MKTNACNNITDTEFDKYLDNLYEEVRTLYLADSRPWVIGFSGGKDSTATLQLIWSSLQSLPAAKLTKEVFIISSDTFVETPVIVNHISQTHELINSSAKEQQLPFKAITVTPEINNTFWVNMIGRGYPAPYSRFRWCTDRLKIEPANKFITDTVANYGEVVVVLGARFSESASRSGSMSKRHAVGNKLTRHSSLPNAWVYTPIEEWQTLEVWEYLLSYPSPWQFDNEDLKQLYQDAQDGDCPLVVDKTTPSCGNSRFGCWSCTVVDKDISMESMINSGNEWLQPLLDFRNWLAATKDPTKKEKIRSVRRRNGRVQFQQTDDGEKKLIWGPFTLEFRKKILKKLLQTQLALQKSPQGAEVTLISEAELLEIRRLWLFEEGDWEDSIPHIYKAITEKNLPIAINDWAGMNGLELQVLQETCKDHDIPVGLLTELFDTERRQFGMSRRATIFNDIDKILKKDWRGRDEVLAEVGISHDLNSAR
ncbi:MAG TPA: DNA phosphorothioation system sulfurtransferase DndC [Gammaproteobacteria bacterium]|nr:DNA phosphorothioation system sulfurtransferase DndC [Gammaproteobacteria bacterium]